MDVPVLIVGFNRPERMAALVRLLRDISASRVYVAVDGPRAGVPEDQDRVAATRAEVVRIDWTDHVRTLFRSNNAGCGPGVSGAIDWFFSHEERGIVLEDDILPCRSFFRFCEELLERYEADPRVWAISGCNFVPPDHLDLGPSYRFSAVPHIWGWATWRRSWESYRYDMSGWRSRTALASIWRASPSLLAFGYWVAMFGLTERRSIESWDYQATFAAFSARGLTATANLNLVTNVGFGAAATHTRIAPDYLRPAEDIRFPLTHPTVVERDMRSERWTARHVLGATGPGMAAQARRFLRRRADG